MTEKGSICASLLRPLTGECQRARRGLLVVERGSAGEVDALAYNNVIGIGRGGTDVLKVDGREVARQTMEHIMQWDEDFDIGADTGTPVDDPASATLHQQATSYEQLN